MNRDDAFAKRTARALNQVLGDIARSAGTAARLEHGHRAAALEELARRFERAHGRAVGTSPEAAAPSEDESSGSAKERRGD